MYNNIHFVCCHPNVESWLTLYLQTESTSTKHHLWTQFISSGVFPNGAGPDVWVIRTFMHLRQRLPDLVTLGTDYREDVINITFLN